MKKLFVILAMLISINGNAQWQSDVRLTNDPAPSTSYKWCIASSGNYVHVVWYDERDGNREIYYKHSTNAGVSWGADTRLTNNSDASEYPSIAVSGSVVHVVWRDYRDGNYEIYYKRSTDAGISWGADTRLTDNFYKSWYPSITVSGSVVHVVWMDDRDGATNYEIYYKRSTNAGLSWGADIRLTNNPGNSGWPSVAVSGSVVHVVWHDEREWNRKIYYKRSTDAGLSWGADTRLTNNNSGSHCPSVSVSGLFLHVVWYDGRDGNNPEIYHKRSTDAGISWGEDTRLTNNTAWSWDPSVAVSGLIVHVVWYESSDGNMASYYKRSTDAGISWGADTRLTNNNAGSLYPSVAVSGSVVHVVWTDGRDGNAEIYYKRDPTGNIGIINISSEIPSSYSLQQNYPNPFNPTTKIKFDITKSSNIKLTVYDILGKQISILADEKVLPGTYEVEFNGTNYPSGVYFYKISAGEFSETKKMLLVK